MYIPIHLHICLLSVYLPSLQDDMMHGRGHYVMADGTEVIGIFAEDEFVE
jgi:hypothetical protein